MIALTRLRFPLFQSCN